MALKKEEFIRSLEGIIERLEQARSDALIIQDAHDVGIRSNDPDPVEVAEEIQGAEAALLVAGSLIDKLAHVLGEEINSLRNLLEKVHEDRD
jgi:hypothetical protein